MGGGQQPGGMGGGGMNPMALIRPQVTTGQQMHAKQKEKGRLGMASGLVGAGNLFGSGPMPLPGSSELGQAVSGMVPQGQDPQLFQSRLKMRVL